MAVFNAAQRRLLGDGVGGFFVLVLTFCVTSCALLEALGQLHGLRALQQRRRPEAPLQMHGGRCGRHERGSSPAGREARASADAAESDVIVDVVGAGAARNPGVDAEVAGYDASIRRRESCSVTVDERLRRGAPPAVLAVDLAEERLARDRLENSPAKATTSACCLSLPISDDYSRRRRLHFCL